MAAHPEEILFVSECAYHLLQNVDTESGQIHFNFVLHWFDELERLVPAR